VLHKITAVGKLTSLGEGDEMGAFWNLSLLEMLKLKLS